jgi:hypothetical protein
MSFKAMWGFNPEEVLKAQKLSVQLRASASNEKVAEGDCETEGVPMPIGRDSQIAELWWMFRLQR